MPMIDISDKPYAPYLTVNTTEDLQAPLLDALDCIWNKPEGKEKIIQASQKGTLTIVYDGNQFMDGYGIPEGYTPEMGEIEKMAHRITLTTHGIQCEMENIEHLPLLRILPMNCTMRRILI
jgi:hypothetical protein